MTKRRSPLTSNRISHHSPRTRHSDSSSRQLHVELEQAFAQLQLYESERQKLYAFNRRSVQDELDARELAQAIAHKTEIEDAIAKHEIVRQQAVAVLEAHIREEEEKRRRQEEDERRQREEEARRKADEQCRIKEEQERKAKEEKERAEAAKRAAAEKAKAEEEERKRKEREATAEKEKQARAKAEAEAEAAKKKEEATKLVAAKSQPISTQTISIPDNEHPWSSHPEIRHKYYLSIHKRLKTFRKEFWDKAKKEPQLKSVVGDMRRVMRITVGQLTIDDKLANTKATKKVKENLLKALSQIPSPPVILNDYLPPHLGLLDKNTTTVPALVLYLISVFSKAIVSAFVNECAINNKTAEPLGTMVAQIFSMPELQFKRYAPSPNSGIHYSAFGGTAPTPPLKPDSVSLITILMAKFHAAAPILFGISGSENTAAGKLRLGWRKEFAKDGDAQKAFVFEQKQYDRIIGLGAGYASVALRNFSKTSLTNPWPPYHFWESLSYIVNTNPSEVQPSHLLLLKSMLDTGVERFIQFFGDEGIAALRKAVIDFPSQLSSELKQTSAAQSLLLLVDTWKKEKNFHLG